MIAERTFQRWRGFPADVPVDLTDPKALSRYLRDVARRLDDYFRDNNAVLESAVGLAARFHDRFSLSTGVRVGQAVYLKGDRMAPANLSSFSQRPMAICESISIASGTGYCWFGFGQVPIAVGTETVSPGSYLYLSSSPGYCKGPPPPAINGSTVKYMAGVGWAIGRSENGLVPAVFAPFLPPQVA